MRNGAAGVMRWMRHGQLHRRDGSIQDIECVELMTQRLMAIDFQIGDIELITDGATTADRTINNPDDRRNGWIERSDV